MFTQQYIGRSYQAFYSYVGCRIGKFVSKRSLSSRTDHENGIYGMLLSKTFLLIISGKPSRKLLRQHDIPLLSNAILMMDVALQLTVDCSPAYRRIRFLFIFPGAWIVPICDSKKSEGSKKTHLASAWLVSNAKSASVKVSKATSKSGLEITARNLRFPLSQWKKSASI